MRACATLARIRRHYACRLNSSVRPAESRRFSSFDFGVFQVGQRPRLAQIGFGNILTPPTTVLFGMCGAALGFGRIRFVQSVLPFACKCPCFVLAPGCVRSLQCNVVRNAKQASSPSDSRRCDFGCKSSATSVLSHRRLKPLLPLRRVLRGQRFGCSVRA